MTLPLQAKAKDNSELANTYGQLQRAFDAFDHCVVLLDVTEEGKWRVLYCNAQLQKLTGRWRSGGVAWGPGPWDGALKAWDGVVGHGMGQDRHGIWLGSWERSQKPLPWACVYD